MQRGRLHKTSIEVISLNVIRLLIKLNNSLFVYFFSVTASKPVLQYFSDDVTALRGKDGSLDCVFSG